MNNKPLAECIAELMELRFTHGEIAARCGCDTSTISRIASGRIADPRDSIARAIRAMARRYLSKRQKAA